MWWTRKQRNPDYDYTNRDKHHKFYNTSNWQRLRLYKLNVNPLCEECLRQSPEVITPANVVDHIISLTDDYSLRLTLTNLQSLCSQHHNVKSGLEKARYKREAAGIKIDERMNELEQFLNNGNNITGNTVTTNGR